MGLGYLQFDIKTAFLYGNLEEEVYMKNPKDLKMAPNKYGDLEKAYTVSNKRRGNER